MQTIEDFPIIMKPADVAKFLQVSRPTAYEIMRRSDFPRLPLNIGAERGNVRVMRDDLWAWLQRQKSVSA